MAIIKGKIVTKTSETYPAKDGTLGTSLHVWLEASAPQYGPADVVVSKAEYERYQIGEVVEIDGFIGNYRKFVSQSLASVQVDNSVNPNQGSQPF